MSLLSSIEGGVVDRFAYVGGLTTQWIKGVSTVARVLPLMRKRGRWNAVIGRCVQLAGRRFRWSPSGACAGFMMPIQCATVLNQFGAAQLVAELVVTAVTKELGFFVTAICLRAQFLTNGRLSEEKSGLEQARAMAH